MDKVDSFSVNSTEWIACEDLQVPGGALVLIPATASGQQPLWITKGHEPYIQGPEEDYYLGLGKKNVTTADTDMLGHALLNNCDSPPCEPTWAQVERAIPPIRNSGGHRGVRTFVGSRSASVDATFSDAAEDATADGFPPCQSYVINLTTIASGEPGIPDFTKYINFSHMADGLLGGHLPAVVFYFPIIMNGTVPGSRYWTMLAAPVPDMRGGREQSVWFRFQQIQCAGEHLSPPCSLRGVAQYWDTYWYSRSPTMPDGAAWVPPDKVASASGFYANLMAVHGYWEDTWEKEGVMRLQLPNASSTNGTWLHLQAVHSLARSMITREDTWHPRYGVLPGYGVSLQDGFQDTFTSTTAAALAFGAFPYAKGVIDNWLRYYIQPNGGVSYRAEEVAVSARSLTLMAEYVRYTGDDDLMVMHWEKAQALGNWLMYRYNRSLVYPPNDPRHGIPCGDDEADTYIGFMYGNGLNTQHFYSAAGEVYRAFTEMGAEWQRIGAERGREDMVMHGVMMSNTAPLIYAALHRSLNATTVPTGNPDIPRCIPTKADPTTSSSRLPHPRVAWGVQSRGPDVDTQRVHTQRVERRHGSQGQAVCAQDTSFRSYPEMLYSGALTTQQVDDIYRHGSQFPGGSRFVMIGCPGYNHKQTTYIAYGWGFGLLHHDMVERFLLHFFAMSAHTYTRGTWTTPEATHPDRDVASTAYVAAGVVTTPVYLKWMLCFEDPNTHTVWIAKATPRDWLAPEEDPIVASRVPTRYGRIAFTISAEGVSPYRIIANVTLADAYASPAHQPAGGVRLRLRTPRVYRGKMKSVTVGGQQWPHFDATAETIDFAKEDLTTTMLGRMQQIRVTFEG